MTSDGRYVDQHTMHFWTSECGLGDYTANSDVLVPIVNYQYSLTGPFYAAGTFTTPTAALITMGLANYQAANGCVLNRGPNTTTYHSTLPRRGEW